MKIKLSFKVALGSFLVAGVGVLFFAYLSYSQITQYFKTNLLHHLSVELEGDVKDIEYSLKNMQNDVKTITNSEEILGLVRASKNRFHYDEVENINLNDWKKRVQKDFYSHMEQHSAYFQIRIIGVKNGGQEIIRVNKSREIIFTTLDKDLQKKGQKEYFLKTTALKKGEVFISKIDLNKEYGTIVFPMVPTIRIATPIYDGDKVFGILIINANTDTIFNLRKYRNIQDYETYLTNSDGYYIFHNNIDKTFSFEFQKDFRIQKDIKADKIFEKNVNQLSFYTKNDLAIYAKKIVIGDDFIVLVRSATNIFLQEQSKEYRNKMFFYFLIVTFMIAIFSTILTMVLTSPITELTKRAKIVANSVGETEVNFNDIDSNDEIGELSNSIATMVENLVASKKELSSFALSLEEEVKKRTREQEVLLSIFDKGDAVLFKWNNDAHWSVDYVSHSVTKLLGYEGELFLSAKIVYSECIYKDDLDTVFQEVLEASESGESYFEHKPYRLITKDGTVKWVYDYTIIVRDEESGEITHFIGYLTDITQLKELNDELEKKVALGINEIRSRDELLTEQSKLASMGEMIGAIAHQWRQPLNELSINIQNLDDDYEDGLIDEKFVDEFIDENKKVITFMSNTIDDFRNFFRIDKTKEFFSVKEAIEQTLSIQGAQLKSHDIELLFSGEDFEINGFKSEFQQVILNLINNAKDALVANEIKDAKIEVYLRDKVIVIADNGGGIPSDVIDRIFEPYFTTKEQGKGTGMGLYMSSMIIRDNMNGSLDVKNIKNGTQFTIGFEDESV